jgi:hypothetical protein
MRTLLSHLQRGVNTHTEEAFAQTPNKLNTNQKQSELKECSPSGEVAPPDSTDFEEDNAHPSEPEFSEIQLTPRDKAIAYAKAFVEKEQVRGRPGYDGPGLFEDDYEALIDLTVAGTMFDGHRNEEKYAWIWTKYYPILEDPGFLDLIEQCKSIPMDNDKPTGRIEDIDLYDF